MCIISRTGIQPFTFLWSHFPFLAPCIPSNWSFILSSFSFTDLQAVCCRCWVLSHCVAFIWFHRHKNRKWLQTCLLFTSCQSTSYVLAWPFFTHQSWLSSTSPSAGNDKLWLLCAVSQSRMTFLFNGIRINLSPFIDRMVPSLLFISFPKVIASLHPVCSPLFSLPGISVNLCQSCIFSMRNVCLLRRIGQDTTVCSD